MRLREEEISVRTAARQLRVAPEHAKVWEVQRRRARESARRDRETAQRRPVRDSARHAEELLRARAPRSDRQVRETRYWESVGYLTLEEMQRVDEGLSLVLDL